MVEFMNILIRNCETYFNSSSAIKICIAKFANIIGELTSNKSIVMPCLGMILYLRDINLSATIAAIGTLHNDLITKLRNLAAEYAPDLEENIQFYLQQTKGFTRLDNRTSTSASNSATTSASKSDSINRYESHSNPRSQKQSTTDLRSRPIPSGDLNGYNSRERIPAEKEVKKFVNERQSSVGMGARPVSASTTHLNKEFKTPRDKGLPPPSANLSKSNSLSTTTATIKSKSVQQSIQIENPSREEVENDDEQEDEEEEEEQDDEEEEEEEDENQENDENDDEEEEEEEEDDEEEDQNNEEDIKEPLETEDVEDFLEAESQAEKEILGEPQQRLAEIVKIESLVR